MIRPAFLLLALATALGGCDMLGIESASQIAVKREADGKAVGGACRHAGRAIEDCYTLNRRSEKASVYAGWREMDDYMRENKLEPVPAQLTPSAVASLSGPAENRAAREPESAPMHSGDKAESASTPVAGAKSVETAAGKTPAPATERAATKASEKAADKLPPRTAKHTS